MSFVLVTGGAGYIGSHTLRALIEAGYKPVVLDNLYSGNKWAVPQDVPFYEGDVADSALVDLLLRKYSIQSVLHFAAHLEVEESTRLPAKYYKNNTAKTLQLLETCTSYGVRHFVFSSTCAVYGTPEHYSVDESFPTQPESPYGASKLMSERILKDICQSTGVNTRYVSLRYFNVAGAHVKGGIGQATPRATQLIKVAAEVALGKRKKLLVYGTDYPTHDGTCIRDYIHVDDLAAAHVLALQYLEKGGASEIFNCGYGMGYSVKEVVESMKRVCGIDFPVEYTGRRPGDAVAIYANNTRITQKLNWQPKHANLDLICKTAFEWEKVLSQN